MPEGNDIVRTMGYSTLITTAALASHLDDPAYVIVDCRFKLDDPEWGEQSYAAAHIPGAIYAHLDRDLSGPKTGTNGRHPLPDSRTLAETLGRLGITSGVQVVAYDQDSGAYASRFWWLARWLGHSAIAVLDGGFAKWIAEGWTSRAGVEVREAVSFVGSPDLRMVVDKTDVARLGRSSSGLLVDARAPERYRGETEPLDPVAGHIPGARNHFFQRNLDERSTFLPPDTLRGQFRETIGDVLPPQIVCYCGSGVTACHNLLAMEHAGLSGARLYPGSWSEWCADPRNDIETG
jgi:thiosulfate/3-mercaptopyruvate sulfurtransferase